MGNAIGPRLAGIDGDEESAVVFSFAEAAALGARNAVVDAYRIEEAAAQQAAANGGGGGGGGAGAGAPGLIGGVLPLADAANAAAEGAHNGLRVLVALLPPGRRRLLTDSEMRQVQAAAAAGASSGVRGAAFMAAMYAPPAAFPPAAVADPEAPPLVIPQAQENALDLERVAAAAATGAWIGCHRSLCSAPTCSSVNSWATRLSPLLGACLGIAGASAPRFLTAAYWETFCVLGGVGILLMSLMIGVAAVPFTSSMKAETVSRHAAFISFITIAVLFLSVVAYMLWDNGWYLVPLGIAGMVALAILVYLWCKSGVYK